MQHTSLPHNHGEDGSIGYLRQQLEKTSHFQSVAELFHQLGDHTRVRIFWLLCHREECVVNLSALLNLSSPAIIHHLQSLKECDLLVNRRSGKEVYYKAADTPHCHLLHKIVEQVMAITCPPEAVASPAEIAQQVHSYLMEHMSERITIEALSSVFHINTTTLKQAFKSVYGTSIAAHMNRHRMEHASNLLTQTQDSIASIAERVGFQSQSRFTTAFKKEFGLLPTEYRKTNK